jgi:predicted nucleic acid-binding protein
MTISIDTNVVVALWWQADPFNQVASQVLAEAQKAGPLILSAPVYAELMGDPARNERELDAFLAETGVAIDWPFEEEIWREAGRRYKGYVRRRRDSGGNVPRRILTDFLIGAHAMIRGYTLLTLDRRLYAAAFPKLRIITD